MRNKIVVGFILVFSISCSSRQDRKETASNQSEKDTVIIHDTIFLNPNKDNWQSGFGLTHNPDIDSIWFKPVSYYLKDEKCSGLASDFYYGYFRPSDNGATVELLKLATTENDKLRPFYRWCLNKTILISDGALGESIGVPARKYAEMYPTEFFQYIDIDTSGEKYKKWIDAIRYSGFDDYDNNGGQTHRQRFQATMLKNIKSTDIKTINRIKQFVIDCTAE